MRRFAPLLLLAAAAAAPGNPPPGASRWPLDEVALANGAKFHGLVLDDTPAGVTVRSVSRQPGRPTVTHTVFVPRKSVVGVKRLPDADRAALKERLAELEKEKGERDRMDELNLTAVDWPGKPRGARRYESDFFTLVSGAPEEVTRRAVVRLERVYAAFTDVLPPAVADARPTAIALAGDPDEYRQLLGPGGAGNLLNPAVFDPAANRIVCGTDLRRLGDDLQKARLHHGQELARIDRYEQDVRALYKTAPPELARHLLAVKAERERVYRADRKNLAGFDAATARLFAILYHEAFHAYVSAFVYRPLPAADVKAGKGTGELPRWLNEGLAQVFETAVVEANELRADQPDRGRLVKIQDWLRWARGAKPTDPPPAARLVPLADLLAAGRDTFLAAHADQRDAADRAYLTSWALAYYLTYDLRLVGTDRFRAYLSEVNTGADPRAAFAALVNRPLPAFEADWHAYLARLRPDGSVGK